MSLLDANELFDSVQDVKYLRHNKLRFWLSHYAHRGERAISDVPNAFNEAGYLHTEKQDGAPCGTLYTGPWLGAAVALVVSPPVPEPPANPAAN